MTLKIKLPTVKTHFVGPIPDEINLKNLNDIKNTNL